MWYIYIKWNTTHPSKGIIMSFAATWMDLESLILSEVSQKEKKKYHTTSLIGGILKKMIQMNLLAKQRETHRLRELTYGCWGKE